MAKTYSPRTTDSTALPGALSAAISSHVLLIFLRFTATITSPGRNPCDQAGVSGSTSTIITAFGLPTLVERMPGYAVGTLGAFWTIQRVAVLLRGLA